MMPQSDLNPSFWVSFQKFVRVQKESCVECIATHHGRENEGFDVSFAICLSARTASPDDCSSM